MGEPQYILVPLIPTDIMLEWGETAFENGYVKEMYEEMVKHAPKVEFFTLEELQSFRLAILEDAKNAGPTFTIIETGDAAKLRRAAGLLSALIGSRTITKA